MHWADLRGSKGCIHLVAMMHWCMEAVVAAGCGGAG